MTAKHFSLFESSPLENIYKTDDYRMPRLKKERLKIGKNKLSRQDHLFMNGHGSSYIVPCNPVSSFC